MLDIQNSIDPVPIPGSKEKQLEREATQESDQLGGGQALVQSCRNQNRQQNQAGRRDIGYWCHQHDAPRSIASVWV